MAGHIVVVVREVWDTRDLAGEVLDDAGAMRAGAMQTRFEPEDLNALETALRLKDAGGGTVTALGIGESRAVDAPRECLYRGADAAARVAVDPDALDDAALARLLAAAIRRLPPADLVLVGTATPDMENSMLARHLAAELGWPAASWIDAVELTGDGRAAVRRAVEMGYEHLDVPLPAVLAIGVALLEDDPRAPRSAKAMLKLKMKKAEIPRWTPADLGVDDPAGARTTAAVRRETVPARVIESRAVDPENEAELRGMLDAVLKGE